MMHKNIKRLIPFLILLLLVLVVYITNLHKALSLTQIQEQQLRFASFVHSYPILSPLIFILIYIVSVCLVIPDSTILSLAGGLLFPFPLAVIYIVFAETVGGTIFFAILRQVFGATLIQSERPFLKKLRTRFNEHNISYLMFLRFSHVLPFWLTNVCAAYFNVSYKTFIWTCFVGVIPLTVILVEAGHSLSVLFAKNRFLTLSDIFTTEIKFALLALGLLALAPILCQNLFKKRKKK